MNIINVAIDGPAGAGKSTISRAAAKEMGYIYIDTGALYRTVGLYVRSKDISADDTAGVISCLPDISLEIKYVDGKQHVYLNGEDTGERIRTPEMSTYASKVSAIPAVRAFLLDTQRDIAKKNSVIMDGRDIGTVILPDAEVKIFLTASEECRAQRRYKELLDKGQSVTYEDVLSDMRQRDERDSTRDVAPTAAASDAVFMDNSDMTFDETVEAVIALVKKSGCEI